MLHPGLGLYHLLRDRLPQGFEKMSEIKKSCRHCMNRLLSTRLKCPSPVCPRCDRENEATRTLFLVLSVVIARKSSRNESRAYSPPFSGCLDGRFISIPKPWHLPSKLNSSMFIPILRTRSAEKQHRSRRTSSLP